MKKILLLSLIFFKLNGQESLINLTKGFEIEITEPIISDTIIYIYEQEARRFLEEKSNELIYIETVYKDWAELVIYRKDFLQIMCVNPIYNSVNFISILRL